jgi:glycosyltransferase involved in cell wall biosynthesis
MERRHMPRTYSIITTCKGRLQHLQRSLPTFLAQPDAEVVVVDYDCPQGTGNWVRTHFPAARVERVSHAPIFNLSRARNIGARAARAPWLVFCDADNVLSDAFTPALAAYLAPNVFVRPYRETGQGAIAVPFPLACEAGVYWTVGGFDDAIEGWGAEDWEFVERLLRHGVEQRVFPVSLVSILDHDDSERTRFYEDAMQVSRLISHYYAQIKARYSETRRRHFTDEQRYAVYRQVKDAVHAALADSKLEALFDVTVPGATPPWTARLRAAEARALHARVTGAVAGG